MPAEHTPSAPSPDDFDRQLRDLTSGAGGAAQFREPSAKERARQAARPGQPQQLTWRNARKTKRLRRPVDSPERRRAGSGQAGRGRQVGNAGRPGRMTSGSRRQRIRSMARTAGVLIAFVALLYVLHLLGFGPQ